MARDQTKPRARRRSDRGCDGVSSRAMSNERSNKPTEMDGTTRQDPGCELRRAMGGEEMYVEVKMALTTDARTPK